MGLRNFIFVFFLLFMSKAALCASQETQELCAGLVGAVQPVPPYGCIDWSAMRLHAVGHGFSGSDMENPRRALRMAERAAKLDAFRNLLELFQNVRIDSRTEIRDYVTHNDTAYNRLAGVLTRTATEQREDLRQGGVRLRVSAALTGQVAAILWEIYPPADGVAMEVRPEGEPEKQAWQVRAPIRLGESVTSFSGLVVDARGLGFIPSLRPTLYAPDGLLYPVSEETVRSAVANGFAGYFREMDAALNSGRCGDAPLILRATALTTGGAGGLLLGQPGPYDLRMLLAKPGGPLSRAAVIIVY